VKVFLVACRQSVGYLTKKAFPQDIEVEEGGMK